MEAFGAIILYLSAKYMEGNVGTGVANCLCTHKTVILVFISRVASQRGEGDKHQNNA